MHEDILEPFTTYFICPRLEVRSTNYYVDISSVFYEQGCIQTLACVRAYKHTCIHAYMHTCTQIGYTNETLNHYSEESQRDLLMDFSTFVGW